MAELILPSDLLLNRRSRYVETEELDDSRVTVLLEDMERIAMGERDEAHPEKRSLVGLAAPQVGELLRIILIDLAADPATPNFMPDLKFFINPQIITTSYDENLGREGCFSTGEICGAVRRANDVIVRALDEDGNEFEHTSTTPFQARILQHEIDHLDGIRFPLRVRTKSHLHRVGPDKFQEYRNNWETWSDMYPYEDWLRMYNGEKERVE